MNGTASPTSEELKDYSAAEDVEEDERDTKGVPFFWATVLKNQVRTHVLKLLS